MLVYTAATYLYNISKNLYMNIGILKAISDDTRFKMLRMLEDGELCVCYFPSRLDVSQSAVSQHLKILLVAGLVAVREDGTKRLYSLSKKGRMVLNDVLGWQSS